MAVRADDAECRVELGWTLAPGMPDACQPCFPEQLVSC
jgi:hypothetical protein